MNNNYFEEIANKRIADRSRYSYYWNDISKYINYFCNDTNNVLEIGCGTGDLLNEISAKSKTGIDYSPSMIAIAHNRYPDIDFIVGKAENLQLKNKYDLIIFSNLIGYLDDVQLVFEELKKVSHSRTKIIINYYNRTWEPVLKFFEFIGLKRKSPPQNWLTRHDVKNLLHLAGYESYRQHKRMLFPVYVPVFSELVNSYVAKLPLVNLLCINNFTFATLAEEVDSNSEYSVSIIVPARNESGNILNCINRIPKFGRSQELIFVEGNSTDDTWEKIVSECETHKHTHNISYYKQSGKGKNDAVKLGFAKATGDILMILDADLTVPPEDLPKFYNALKNGKGDFINGSRLIYPMENRAMRPLNIVGNKVFGTMFSWLLEQKIKDTLCGTKVLFRSDYLKIVKNRSFFGDFDPFGDFDLLFGAFKLNLKIMELPVRYRERTYGSTNISRFKHGLILLRMCVFAARKIKFV